VARAKRTNRAEARRRYRATLIDDPGFLEDEEADIDSESIDDRPSPGLRRDRATATQASPSPTGRAGVIGALRTAFRPADVRGDIAALPQLLRHRSFLIPFATIVAAAAIVAVTGGQELISRTLSPYFLAPPPVAPVFIAGFLAPRASYLIGGLLGIISSVAVIAVLSTPGMQQVATGTTTATALTADVLVYSLVLATLGGAFYAAAAAWYKRFLALASPSRAVRAMGGKPNDRSRKRDSGDRPMLARRR
jgi:hypothetical protein